MSISYNKYNKYFIVNSCEFRMNAVLNSCTLIIKRYQQVNTNGLKMCIVRNVYAHNVIETMPLAILS